VQTLKDGGFYSLYKFELVRYGQADCEVGHFYSHKHPKATFVNNLVVSKIMDQEVRSLRNHEYWLITASGEQRHAITDGTQLQMILTTQFGVSATSIHTNTQKPPLSITWWFQKSWIRRSARYATMNTG